jgi:hypothetical protein
MRSRWCFLSTRLQPPPSHPSTSDATDVSHAAIAGFCFLPRSVQLVYIRLFRMHDTIANSVTYVSFIGLFAAGTGSVDWVVPNVPERDDYVILVNHYASPAGSAVAPTHRNTGSFEIRAANHQCDPGTINAVTGLAPCSECPVGSFSANTTHCAGCPNGTTTGDTGALSETDCTINASHPLFSFIVIPHHYLRGSVIPTGFYLEDIDHKTIAECAQLCLDDGGCKAFMAGVSDQHQAGDCFLSYDDRGTAWPGGFQEISQLSYYERRDTGTNVATSLFRRDAGCFLVEHDGGGLHENQFTPESCAQLCLNDVCCESFDAGDLGSANVGHCFLSYTTKMDQPSSFVCDPARQMNYYGLAPSIEVSFGFDLDGVVNSSRQAAFATLVGLTAQNGAPQPPNVTLRTTTDGRVVAMLQPQSRADLVTLTDFVTAGMLSFTFPAFVGHHYVGGFTLTEGPCELGTVSQTGQKPCFTCRSDTYANKAQTLCQECPVGTSSTPGSFLVEQCTVPTAGTALLLNLHDEFVGRYFEPSIGGGTVMLRVSNVSGNGIEMIATVEHGGYCNSTLDCRTEGRSEYYLRGTVVNDTVLDLTTVAGYYGWVGITDRGFVRAPLTGRIEISDTNTVYSGQWGVSGGEFSTARRCTVGAENVTSIQVGDVYAGYFECETAAGDQDPREVIAAQLTIESIALDDTISAVVSVLSANGTYAYAVQGDHDADARCSGLQLTARGADGTANPAWRTEHSDGLLARQWSGHISEDGEYYVGTVNTNPHCDCINSSPYSSGASTPSIEQFCGRISETECWVASSCPEAIESTQFPGWYSASIGPHRTCSTFKLARVCNIPPQLCSVGWTQFAQRCYKVFGTPQTFADAANACTADSAAMVSIHSALESRFVRDQIDQDTTVANGDRGVLNGTAWIGIGLDQSSGQYSWFDGSLFVFTDWAAGYPRTALAGTTTSVAMTDDRDDTWIEVGVQVPLPFVCKKGLLAVDLGCACSGVSDSFGAGASCLYWGDSAAVPWCYTTQNCRTAGRNASTELWHTPCTPTEAVTTCRLRPLQGRGGTPQLGFCCPTGQYYNVTSSTCGVCLTPTDCAVSGTVLYGTCEQSGTYPGCVTAPTAAPTAAPTVSTVAPTGAFNGGLFGSSGSAGSSSTSSHIGIIYVILLVVLIAIIILVGLVVKLHNRKDRNVVTPINLTIQNPHSDVAETAFAGEEADEGHYADIPAAHADEPLYADVAPAVLVGADRAVYFDPAADPFDDSPAPVPPVYATVRPRQLRPPKPGARPTWAASAQPSKTRTRESCLSPINAAGDAVASLEEDVYETEIRLDSMRQELFHRTMVPPEYDAGSGGAAPDSGAVAAAGAAARSSGMPLPHRSSFQRQLDKQREGLAAAADSSSTRNLVDPFDVGTDASPEPFLPGMVDDSYGDGSAAASPSVPRDAALDTQLKEEAIALESYRRQSGRPRIATPERSPADESIDDPSDDTPPDYHYSGDGGVGAGPGSSSA